MRVAHMADEILESILLQYKRVRDLQDSSLVLTSKILTKTFNDLNDNKITPLDAAKIVSLLGLKIDSIVNTHPDEKKESPTATVISLLDK
jgi:hypothetical protein